MAISSSIFPKESTNTFLDLCYKEFDKSKIYNFSLINKYSNGVASQDLKKIKIFYESLSKLQEIWINQYSIPSLLNCFQYGIYSNDSCILKNAYHYLDDGELRNADFKVEVVWGVGKIECRYADNGIAKYVKSFFITPGDDYTINWIYTTPIDKIKLVMVDNTICNESKELELALLFLNKKFKKIESNDSFFVSFLKKWERVLEFAFLPKSQTFTWQWHWVNLYENFYL